MVNVVIYRNNFCFFFLAKMCIFCVKKRNGYTKLKIAYMRFFLMTSVYQASIATIVLYVRLKNFHCNLPKKYEMASVIIAHRGPKATDPKAGRVEISWEIASTATRDRTPILATNLEAKK